jgi:hypothetical protein
MSMAWKLGAVALLLSLSLTTAFADSVVTQPICVTNNSQALMIMPGNFMSYWALVAGGTGPGCNVGEVGLGVQGGDPPIPATYVVGEAPSPTAPEALGDFTFNTTFTTPQGYYTIADVTGGISDYILLGNTFNGNGEILFYSDPLPALTPAGTNYQTLCNEDVTGCMGSFVIQTALGAMTVTAASDGEGPFDPFHVGQNISDGISFAPTPEPSQLPIALAMLVAACGARRWLRA